MNPAWTLLLNLSESERARCEGEAKERIKNAAVAKRRADEAALLPEGERRLLKKAQLVSAMSITRTQMAYKIVLEGMDDVVLPVMQKFGER